MSRPKSLWLLAVASLVLLLVSLPAASAFAANPVHWVVASDVSASRAASGATSWFADPNHSGTYATTANAFDGSTALELSTPAASDGIRILNSYGVGVTPPTVAQIQAGGSYAYSGSNVDFQIELFFTPSDPGYGPDPANGVNKCTAAGAAYPGMCYTVIKWEPLATSPTAWSTVDLSSNAALSATTGGWKNTNEIGIYPKPGALIGNTMTEYLAQMANYQVLAVGVSVGTGTAASVGYVKTMTYAAQSYNFRSEPMISPVMTPARGIGTIGTAYSKAVTVTGTGPFSFSITAGGLPVGLSLDPTSGTIAGVPTTKGVAAFTVTVVGPGGSTAQADTITVGAVKTLATTGVGPGSSLALAASLFLVAGVLMFLAGRRRFV